MNADIGKILAVAIPVCLSAAATFIAIAFRIVGTKSRKVLPACKEWFEKTEREINDMKKASTDRQQAYSAIQAKLELMIEAKEQTRDDIKELAASVQKQAVEFATFNQKLKYISDSIDTILNGIEKRRDKNG